MFQKNIHLDLMDINYLLNNKTDEEKIVLIKQMPLLLKYVKIDKEMFENLFEDSLNKPELFNNLILYYKHYIEESHIDSIVNEKNTWLLGKLDLSAEKKMEIYKRHPPFFKYLDKKQITDQLIIEFIKSDSYDLYSMNNLKYKHMLLTIKHHPSMISTLLRITDEKYRLKLVKFFVKHISDKKIELKSQYDMKNLLEIILKLDLNYLELITLEKIFNMESSLLLLKTHHNYKEEAGAIIDLINQN